MNPPDSHPESPIPPLSSAPPSGAEGGLISHVAELRTRVMHTAAVFLASFVLSYLFAEPLFAWISAPLMRYLPPGEGHGMIFTGLPEAFMTYMRLSCYAAACVTAPYGLVQLYLFAAPGLYDHEKGAARAVLWGVPALFYAGMMCAYYLVMPAAWGFFAAFQSKEAGMTMAPRVSEYLETAWQLLFAFGAAFQFPLILMCLIMAEIVSPETLRKGRKVMAVACLFVGAVVTPPDVLSQLMMAVPLMLCYEAVIWAGSLALKRRKARYSGS